MSDERLASLEDEELRTTARVLRNNVEAVQRAAEDDTQVEPDDLDYLEDSLDELAEVCRRVG